MQRRSIIVLTVMTLLRVFAGVASAQTSGTGTVTVTATNSAAMTISIADSSAAFGANLNPAGTNTGGEISSTVGSTGSQGAYYLWSPASTPNITVRSNATWNGTVAAGENSGSS